MFGPNFVKSILKTVQRGSCNYWGLQTLTRIDHTVTESVVSCSCVPVRLFEFERMASGGRLSVLWKEALVDGVYIMYTCKLQSCHYGHRNHVARAREL